MASTNSPLTYATTKVIKPSNEGRAFQPKSSITRFRNIFHTAVTGTATAILIAGGASAAQASVFTFNYDGVVTKLIAVGRLLPLGADIRGVKVGDRVSGSYSYDDRLLSSNQSNFAVLTDFIYSLQANQGKLFYGVRNTAIVSTFEPIIASNPEPITEFSSTFALLAVTLACSDRSPTSHPIGERGMNDSLMTN